jgi:hypothetical protein
MTDFLDKDVVYINSAARINGTSSAFTIDISQQVRTPNEYDSIALISAYIPKSYYLITSSNNTFQVNEVGYLTKTITIPVGNYNLTSMTTTLTTLLNSAGLNWTYTVNISTSTGLITFTNNGNAVSSFIFADASPYRILGFNKTTHNFYLVGGIYTLVSPNIINLQAVSNILVMSNIVDKQLLSSVVPSSSDFSSILYVEQDPFLVSKTLISNNVQSIYFFLLDGITMKPIELNGLDISLTLVIYKRNNYYNIMIADHQLKLLQQEYQDKSKWNIRDLIRGYNDQ